MSTSSRQSIFSPSLSWVLLLGFLGCGVYLWLYTPLGFMDDAYITLHNAGHLWHAVDPRYGSPPLTGATSLPHTVLVALLALVMPPLWALWLASALGFVAYLLGVFALARSLKLSTPLSLALTGLALFPVYSPFHLLNGLETSLAMACVIWILVAVVRPCFRWPLALLLGLLPFLRPEGAALSGLIWLWGLWHHRHHNAAPPAESSSSLGAFALRWTGVAALAAAPWILLSLGTTGHWLPSTISAKRAFFAESCAPWTWKFGSLAHFAQHFASQAGVWLVALPLLLLTTLGRMGLVFALSIGIAYTLFLPGALSHSLLRYAHAWVPFLVYGVALGLKHLQPYPKAIRWLLVGALGLQALLQLPQQDQQIRGLRRYTLYGMQPAYRWLSRHTSPGTKVLVHDAGYIATQTSLSLHDMVGLKTPSSVPWHQQWTLRSCGALRHVAIHRIAQQSGATYMVVSRSWNRIFGFAPSLLHHQWKLRLVYQSRSGPLVFQLVPPPHPLRRRTASHPGSP